MNVTERLQAAMKAVQDNNLESMREYDVALVELARACREAHRKLTVSDEDVTYQTEVATLCRDFVIDVYFKGVAPKRGVDVDDYHFVQAVRKKLVPIVRGLVGVEGKSVVYGDEASEIRIRLMAKSDICEMLESKVGARTRERLVELRSTT